MPAPTGLKKPATFDHLKKKQPLERKVTIPLSQEAVDAYHDAEQAYERAKILNEPADALKEALDAARAAVLEESVQMVFRSIGRKAYDALLEEFPPTEEQIAEYRKEHADKDGNPAKKGEPPYNIELFAPALIAASCVEPKMTVDQVNEIFDEWNSTEIAEIWTAAHEVNTSRRVVQLGNG